MDKNLVEEYVYTTESSRWIDSIAKKSGKPPEEVERAWNDAEREVTSTLRKGGITDNLSHITKIVKDKFGVEDTDVVDRKNKDESK